ncbi:MAG: recombination mediator RecR [Proteobacteria bacterium]|nr:recombination mediator RecR [Pseudomonadota bacterium]MBU4296902.1 recombination mediator RecR [Pseudomonadota bacterium]MCG2749280.1 recombination mediator RecR [Desulfobulbaceae bacterium]
MNVVPPALARLIADLNRLPGVGRKTATRLALHLLRRPASEAQAMARDLQDLHETIRLCTNCFAFSETEPCAICADSQRDSSLICVVEEAADLMAIEKTGTFKGQYHILHGVLSPMDGVGPEELKMQALLDRIDRQQVAEVLIATSSTVPGEATAAYLIDSMRKKDVKITRLACGIPMGMDIKYADELTLSRAIEARKRY